MIAKSMNSKIRAANERASASFARHAAPIEDPPLSRVERALLRKVEIGDYKLHGLMPESYGDFSLRRR